LRSLQKIEAIKNRMKDYLFYIFLTIPFISVYVVKCVKTIIIIRPQNMIGKREHIKIVFADNFVDCRHVVNHAN